QADLMPGHVKRIDRAMARPPNERPHPSRLYLPAGTTPASKPTADANKARPAIRSPSAARRRFDRREVLRSTGDVLGPARGLRVGGEDRRSCEQQCDRKGERDFAHQVSPEVCGMCPTWQCRDRPFYRGRSFGPREYRGLSVKLEFDLPAAS